MTGPSWTAPSPVRGPSLRTDILLTYAGIGLGLLGGLGAALPFQRYDALTYVVILVAGPPAAIGLLLAPPRRPRSLYVYRVESAFAGYAAAYAGLFAINVFLPLLVALGPVLLLALLLVWEGALVALVMMAAERLRSHGTSRFGGLSGTG